MWYPVRKVPDRERGRERKSTMGIYGSDYSNLFPYLLAAVKLAEQRFHPDASCVCAVLSIHHENENTLRWRFGVAPATLPATYDSD